MSKYCSNCGTKKVGGLCPYCHEEALILEEFCDVDVAYSDEFYEKAAKQRKEANEQTEWEE